MRVDSTQWKNNFIVFALLPVLHPLQVNLHIRNLNPDLMRRVKAQAASAGKTLREWVIEVIEWALKEKS